MCGASGGGGGSCSGLFDTSDVAAFVIVTPIESGKPRQVLEQFSLEQFC